VCFPSFTGQLFIDDVSLRLHLTFPATERPADVPVTVRRGVPRKEELRGVRVQSFDELWDCVLVIRQSQWFPAASIMAGTSC
jgi:hypothetical protein